MSTYEIPDEPDVRDMWGPTPDGEGWVHYERFNTTHRLVGNWREVGNPHAGTYTWLELIVRGPLHDENPDPPLEVLRDQIVEAALAYYASTNADTHRRLNRVISKYNVKKGTT